MKKTTTYVLGAFVLMSLAAFPAYGQTAQGVLSRMIDAMGGRKTLEAIKDTTISGSVEISQYGITASVTMFQKEPDKMRMDIDVMGLVITRAYDGKTGWQVNPQTGMAEEIPEFEAKELARQALGNEAFLNPKKLGITFALRPKETIDGKEYLVLEQTLADGHTTTFFIDPDTHLPYKTRARATGLAGVEVDSETFLTDYRKVQNTTVAHSIRNLQGGTEVMRLTVATVAYNSNLDDALFTMR